MALKEPHINQNPEPEMPPNTHWLVRLKQMLSPKYHWEQLKKDLRAFQHAITSVRKDIHEHDVSKLEDLFHGRMMVAFYISGPFNMVAVGLVQWLQYRLGFAYTVWFLPVVALILTGIVFQLAWWGVNREMYRKGFRSPVERLVALERDLWPIHVASASYAALFWLINLAATSVVIRVVQVVSPIAAVNVPWIVIATTVELIVVAPGFVRNIGDFFWKHSKVLTNQHRGIFCQIAKEETETAS